MEVHDNVPDDASPNTDAEADLIPTLKVSMRFVTCPESTVVLQHAFTLRFVCPQEVVCEGLICSVLVS
jgi:hypothetical protein